MGAATTGRIIGGIFLIAAAALLASVVWQQLRYLRIRRAVVRDRQRLFHGARSFHVVTLAKLRPGTDLLEATDQLVRALEHAGGARVAYAGKRLVVGLQSQQLPEVTWDLVLLSQYASREAYETARGSPEQQAALKAFAQTFEQGFRRNPWLNLALPILLLLRRLADILMRRPARTPFELADPDTGPPGAEGRDRAQRIQELRREAAFGKEAVVVLNFVRRGTKAQQARNAAYSWAMLGLMAERVHGPMHLGRAVTVEGNASFDSVALVYYPGVSYFADMTQSTFFRGIIGDKQLGDTFAMVTAPLLDRLPLPGAASS